MTLVPCIIRNILRFYMALGWVLLFVLIDTSSIFLTTSSLLEVCRKKLGKMKDRQLNIPAFNR